MKFRTAWARHWERQVAGRAQRRCGPAVARCAFPPESAGSLEAPPVKRAGRPSFPPLSTPKLRLLARRVRGPAEVQTNAGPRNRRMLAALALLAPLSPSGEDWRCVSASNVAHGGSSRAPAALASGPGGDKRLHLNIRHTGSRGERRPRGLGGGSSPGERDLPCMQRPSRRP